MSKVKTDASIILLLIIAVLLVVGIVGTVFALRPDPFQESFAEGKPINTLFIIESEETPFSSYVLMFYPATRRGAIFDIPGSLGLIIQQINRMDRIDAVYDPRRIAPYRNEIERLLGIDIAFSIVITLDNLSKITDLIQGVEVFIPSQVDVFLDEHILLPSGVSKLDGDKARLFISYYLPDENRELVNQRRQRFFMGFIRGLGEQSHFLGTPQVSTLFYSFLNTEMNQRTLVRLINEIAAIDMDRISIQTVGGDIREVSGQTLIFPHDNGARIRDIVRQTQGILIQEPGSYFVDRTFTVEVLNGTTQTGLAARTAELLGGFGYEITTFGNADRNDYDRTLIIDRSGYREMAIAFGDIIRCSNIRFDAPDQQNVEDDFIIRSFENRSDFTIILGRDFNGRFVTE